MYGAAVRKCLRLRRNHYPPPYQNITDNAAVDGVWSVGTEDVLKDAAEKVNPGETIKLTADITLAADTNITFKSKGTAESPVVLDLNGHTLSGDNGGTLAAEGGIINAQKTDSKSARTCLQIVDTSSDKKGCIINTSEEASITVMANYSDITIEDGIKIVTDPAHNTSRGIYSYGGNITITDAHVSAGGYPIYTSGRAEIIIYAGSFVTTAGSDTTIHKSSFGEVKIHGGTFSKLERTDLAYLADDKYANVGSEGQVSIEASAPSSYIAHIGIDNQNVDYYNRIYFSNIEDNFEWLTGLISNNNVTLYINQNCEIAYPEGEFLGKTTGTLLPITIDIAEGATLSGNIPLGLAKITVTGGGTVAADVFSEANGYTMTAADRTYTSIMSDGNVAAIVTGASGDTMYYDEANVASAIGVGSGGTITLQKDCNTSRKSNVSAKKETTLDLNGHSLTFSMKSGAGINVRGTLNVVGGGTITAETSSISALATVYNGAKISIGEDVTVNGAVFINEKNCTLDVYGEINTGDEAVNMAITAIIGNGSFTENSTINIYEGAKVYTGRGSAIYHPNSGTLNIHGGEITGSTAIYAKAGHVIINGGTITAIGEKAEYKYKGDGYATTGDAIVLDSCDYPGGVPSLTINGGNVISQNAKAVACYEYGEAKPAAATINAGTFSSDITEYMAPTSAYKTDNGTYTVIGSNSDKVSEPGIYKSAATDGTYEQMQLFEAKDISGNITFTVTSDEGSGTAVLELPADVSGTVKFGLIVTEIPVGQNITISYSSDGGVQ